MLKLEIVELVTPDSGDPQLNESMLDILCSTAYSMAVCIALKLDESVNKRTIFAYGAIACAHSTSVAVSIAQELLKLDPEELFVYITFRLAGGSPVTLSKAPRSYIILGSPYASTIPMVVPFPFILFW